MLTDDQMRLEALEKAVAEIQRKLEQGIQTACRDCGCPVRPIERGQCRSCYEQEQERTRLPAVQIVIGGDNYGPISL